MTRPVRATLLLTMLFAGISPAKQPEEKERSWIVLPGYIHLDGPGSLYGLAGGVRHVYNGRTDIIAGKTFGHNSGSGILIRDIPFFGSASLNLFAAAVEKARLVTSYTRGLEEDSPLYLLPDGKGAGLTAGFTTLSGFLHLSGGLISSSAGFRGFESLDGKAILLPGAFLPDVKTLTFLLKGNLKSHASPVPSEVSWYTDLEVKADTGRTGQADQLTTTLQLAVSKRTTPWFEPAARIRLSSASILKKQTRYETRDGVLEILNADCDQLLNQERSACQKLREELADFIATNNRYGTARPAGGSTGLRGFRELRFKAAHTQLASAETRFILSTLIPGPFFLREENELSLVPFADIGYAADLSSKLYKKFIVSTGISLRLRLKKIPFRLSLAQSNGDPLWFFTVGNPW